MWKTYLVYYHTKTKNYFPLYFDITEYPQHEQCGKHGNNTTYD